MINPFDSLSAGDYLLLNSLCLSTSLFGLAQHWKTQSQLRSQDCCSLWFCSPPEGSVRCQSPDSVYLPYLYYFLLLWTTSPSCSIPLFVLTPDVAFVPLGELILPPGSTLTQANVISPQVGPTLLPSKVLARPCHLFDRFLQMLVRATCLIGSCINLLGNL